MIVLLVLMSAQAQGPATAIARKAVVRHLPRPKAPVRGDYGIAPAPAADQVAVKLQLPLRSGLLFNVRTGQVLWQRNPTQIVAIASLTKMMTALLVASDARPNAQVLITSDALHYTGSGVGLLPKGKRVPLVALLYGLLLPSGNDAAIALADHVAGTQQRFIALMNRRARALGLRCTHYTTVSGIVDQGNHSCAQDLALIAHLVLEKPLLARIVASRSAILPFPIKGGKLFLYNNNPLLAAGYPGADGVKTGFTDASGPCLVATARRGNTWLGVVLLHSGNTSAQAQQLLNAGFAKLS
ncbi:MAG: D-alanyl-D-alanine carboxypeptidase [Acetobacteraceae bacterium]|nr:D-alanyl-D-alanine carboxypeptidase [Acetobacteraceae bacterium]